VVKSAALWLNTSPASAGDVLHFLRGWSFRGEYLYDHFNPKQYDWVSGISNSELDLTIHTVRGAVIYHFPI
jgi:hypothetical protein